MSYGANAPQGFRTYITSSGSPLNGALSTYPILSAYGTGIFTGDPVAPLANGTIGIGVAGAGVYGIFQGVTYYDANNVLNFAPYWAAGTALFGGAAATASALVIDDPAVEFSIQVDTSNAGVHLASLAQTDLNDNANFVIAAGSTRNGLSATYLDAATIAHTATLNCKLLRLESDPRNRFGILYPNVIVTLNNHILKGGTGTLGV